jgi:hypothetical protein
MKIKDADLKYFQRIEISNFTGQNAYAHRYVELVFFKATQSEYN